MFTEAITVNNKQYDLKILFDLSNKKLDLSEFSKKIDAQLRSYEMTGINISKFNFVSLFPNKEYLFNLLEQINKKQLELFQETQDPDVLLFYERFRSFLEVLNKINGQTLNTDLKPNKISFNATGSKDGRLSTKKGFLNIYSLAKEERHRIKCESDDFRFVQCDYRSFQPRLAIFLTKDDKFKQKFAAMKDIYGSVNREEQKLNFFRTMFGIESSPASELGPIFDLRTKIYREIVANNKILNPFGRPLWFDEEAEHVVFRNFITTCEADFVFNVAVKLDALFAGRKSKIKFLFHDAIIFEIHKEETSLMKQIKDIMENSFLDNVFFASFPVKMQVGKNFGELYDLPTKGSV